MKKIFMFLMLFGLLSLTACGNKETSKTLNQKTNTGGEVIFQEGIKKETNDNINTANSDFIKKNVEVYTEIIQKAFLPKKEKKKVVQKINTVKTELVQTLGEKIEPVAIITYKEIYLNEIKKLEKLNTLEKKVNSINDINTRNSILNKIKLEKKKIFTQLKSYGIVDSEIKAIDKFTSLPENKKEKILQDLHQVSSYIIPEAGGKIVSKEFKQKYDEAKQQLLEISRQNGFTGNGPIPYDVVIEYMIKQELIKQGKCDKLENDIERAECEGRKGGY